MCLGDFCGGSWQMPASRCHSSAEILPYSKDLLQRSRDAPSPSPPSSYLLVLPKLKITYKRLRTIYILIWGPASRSWKEFQGLWSGRKLQINHQLGPSRAEKGSSCGLVPQQQPQSPGWPQLLVGSDIIPWGQSSSYSQLCQVQAGASPPSVLWGLNSGA